MTTLTYKRIMPNYSDGLSLRINEVISSKLQHQNWIEKNMQIAREVFEE